MQTERKLSFPLFLCVRDKYCTADWKAVLWFWKFFGGGFFYSDSTFYRRQKLSVSSALDMESAHFSCGILVLWTQQVCSWSPTSQFKQCWSFLLASFTKWQFCVILLTFHLPIQCQQCPSFPSSEFFVCLLTICQVMMFFQRTIFALS